MINWETQKIASALTSMLYRNWKLLGLLAASFTAWASSKEPRPPCDQWWHGTASDAPHSFAIWHTRSISVWVSVLKDHRGKHCKQCLVAMYYIFTVSWLDVRVCMYLTWRHWLLPRLVPQTGALFGSASWDCYGNHLQLGSDSRERGRRNKANVRNVLL